ncbi:MAG: ATP-binding cassette domain-containing protein [Kangiellaceae bacterium]|nr:ATP-binding cassette domain-containing protein [Kangiellaceae bacterium]
MNSAIEITGLSKSFGNQRVLSEVSINVPHKSVYGFLGNNGAGKSTLIRILLGLLHSDSGTIRIDSQQIRKHDIEYKRSIGSIIDSPSLYLQLTPRDYLGITCKLKGLRKNHIDDVVEIVAMKAHLDNKMERFSLGMKQRIAIANALLGKPKLLILDEPTNGLDPEGMREIRRLLKQLPERTGATVFLSSHLLDEIEKTASHVGILHHGNILIESSLVDLQKQFDGSLDIKTDNPDRLLAFSRNADMSVKLISNNTLRFNKLDRVECASLNHAIIDAGFQLIESKYNAFSLESFFLNLVNSNTEVMKR